MNKRLRQTMSDALTYQRYLWHTPSTQGCFIWFDSEPSLSVHLVCTKGYACNVLRMIAFMMLFSLLLCIASIGLPFLVMPLSWWQGSFIFLHLLANCHIRYRLENSFDITTSSFNEKSKNLLLSNKTFTQPLVHSPLPPGMRKRKRKRSSRPAASTSVGGRATIKITTFWWKRKRRSAEAEAALKSTASASLLATH